MTSLGTTGTELAGAVGRSTTRPVQIAQSIPDAKKCQIVALSGPVKSAWDRYINDHAEGTLFHGSAWHDAVSRAFPHTPYYLVAHRGSNTVGALPMFLVRSRLAGRMLVSVPYGVGGGVIANDDRAATALVTRAKEIADEQRCTLLDLRSARAVMPDQPVIDQYVTFDRELPGRAADVLAWLPRKARAAARNARTKYGLTVDWNQGNLREVWRLYTISMRRLGSLSYPFAFFEELVNAMGKSAWISTVSQHGKPVAGLMSFVYRDRVMPYFFGSTDAAKRCSAANFAYLTLMERAVDTGICVFDFGRSRQDNKGSYNFKRLHGFTPKPLEYQSYVPDGIAKPNLSPSNPNYRLARRVWPHLPLFLTQSLGAAVAKHIPG